MATTGAAGLATEILVQAAGWVVWEAGTATVVAGACLCRGGAWQREAEGR